jgi:hypothetical protein
MCALAIQGAAGPVRHGRRALRLSAFRLRIFLSFFSVLFRSFPSVIRAKAVLANASTGICPLQLRMEHRLQSVVTVHSSAVT